MTPDLPTAKEIRVRLRTSAANCQLLYEGGQGDRSSEQTQSGYPDSPA